MGGAMQEDAVFARGLTIPFAEVGDAAAAPVVFVHAYVESWRYFEKVLRQLPDSLHGYALTQRGHGDADKPAHGYGPSDFATDIVAFMDALGIDRAALVGTSSGGLVSQIVATRHPERISALVLISSPAFLGDKPAVREKWEEIALLADPVDRRFVEEFVRSTSPATVPEDFVATCVEETLKVPAHVWKEALRGLMDLDARPGLGRITAPTLLITGDQDAIVSSDQQVLRDAIPNSRLTTYEGVGHAVHLAEPERVVDDVSWFLEGGSA